MAGIFSEILGKTRLGKKRSSIEIIFVAERLWILASYEVAGIGARKTVTS